MDVRKFIDQIDQEVSRLTAARAALLSLNGGGEHRVYKQRAPATVVKKRHHRMSPAMRRKMSLMMKQRWAARKKT